MASEFSSYIDLTIDVLHAAKGLDKVIQEAARTLIETAKNGGTIFICGNGGSAAESQHWAAELVGRFRKEGKPVSALALTVDTSALTAIGNDFGFDLVYERQLLAHGRKGDCIILLSTSGKSKNVVLAAQRAQEMGLKTIGITGKNNGALGENSDVSIQVPSEVTEIVQHAHLVIGHFLMGIVEMELRGNE